MVEECNRCSIPTYDLLSFEQHIHTYVRSTEYIDHHSDCGRGAWQIMDMTVPARLRHGSPVRQSPGQVGLGAHKSQLRDRGCYKQGRIYFANGLLGSRPNTRASNGSTATI